MPDRVRLYPGAAALKLTSGTSGRFKAAFTTESQLMADGAQIAGAFGTGPGDVQVVAIPLSHAYGLGTILLPLLMQGTRVVLRDTFVPQQVLGDAVTYSAGVFCGVPFMFDHFLAHHSAEPWPPTLTGLRAAGARLDPFTQSGFRRTFGVSVHSFYGASETGGICFDAGDEPPSETVVGRPLPGVQVTLLPFEDAEPGVGQVHIASPAVSDGYVGESGGFVNGGFLSGKSRPIRSRGAPRVDRPRLELRERRRQESAARRGRAGVARNGGCTEAAVLGVEDPVHGELLVACLVGDASTGLIDVRRYCLARLAPHKVPRRGRVAGRAARHVTRGAETDRPTAARDCDQPRRGSPPARYVILPPTNGAVNRRRRTHQA